MVLKRLYNAFDVAEPYIAWFLLVAGLLGVLLTVVGVLPPFGDNLFGRIVASLGWLLVALEGHDRAGDWLEEEQGEAQGL